MSNEIKLSRTQRLLHSFSSVKIKNEHRNYGDEAFSLRGLGMSAAIATQLIHWGEQHHLVCTFENEEGKSSTTYHWKPEFLIAAHEKHIELFGQEGRDDFPVGFSERLLLTSVKKSNNIRTLSN